MTSVSWTQTTNGSWTTPAAWATSSGASGDPQRGDDVSITLTNTVAITYGTGNLFLDSLTTGLTDTLDVTGGLLATMNGYAISGALNISGGTLRLSGGAYGAYIGSNITMTAGTLDFAVSGSVAGGVLNENGGTITIGSGIFYDQDFGNLSGTVNGNGQLLFEDSAANGSTVLQSGFVLATASAEITNTTVFLEENVSYGNVFTLGSTGVLNLNGNAAILSGLSAIDGVVRGGSLTLAGTGHLNGLVLDNGAAVSVTGTYNQTGNITLGSQSGTGTMTLASGALLRIVGNDSIYLGSGNSELINNGTIDKIGGNTLAGNSVIYSPISNTGLIQVGLGTLDFYGPAGGSVSTIGGTLAGAGTVAFSQGFYLLSGETLTNDRTLFNGSVNVTLATALSYAGSWDQTGGLILVENALALTGEVAFDGGEMKGTATVTVGAGLVHMGQGMDLEGNLTFNLGEAVQGGSLTTVAETIDQTGAINLGALSDSVDQATIETTTVWNLEGASAISGIYGTITNYGLFDKTSGATDAVVQSDFTNVGSLLVNSGTLTLSGQGELGGTVGGSAVLDLVGGFELAAGLALTVGELIIDANNGSSIAEGTLEGSLAYNHDFAMEGGTLALNGFTLTLGGVASLGGGAILGSGAVQVNTAATIGALGALQLAQGADLVLDANTQQLSNIIMTGGAAAPVLTIGKSADYTVNNGLFIGGVQDTIVGTVTVDGTLSAVGNSTIAATVLDNGKINLSEGEISFMGPLQGTGALAIGAGAVLDLDTSSYTKLGVTFAAGGAELFLQSPADFGGVINGFATSDVVEIGGFAFVGATLTLASSGTTATATINEINGSSITLNFSNAQTMTSLSLGVGSHGGLALIHN